MYNTVFTVVRGGVWWTGWLGHWKSSTEIFLGCHLASSWALLPRTDLLGGGRMPALALAAGLCHSSRRALLPGAAFTNGGRVGLWSSCPGLPVLGVQKRRRKVQFMFCWKWWWLLSLLSLARCLPSCLDPIQCLMSCNGMELLSLGFSFCSFLKCLPGKLTAQKKSLDQQGSTGNCWGQP